MDFILFWFMSFKEIFFILKFRQNCKYYSLCVIMSITHYEHDEYYIIMSITHNGEVRKTFSKYLCFGTHTSFQVFVLTISQFHILLFPETDRISLNII